MAAIIFSALLAFVMIYFFAKMDHSDRKMINTLKMIIFVVIAIGLVVVSFAFLPLSFLAVAIILKGVIVLLDD